MPSHSNREGKNLKKKSLADLGQLKNDLSPATEKPLQPPKPLPKRTHSQEPTTAMPSNLESPLQALSHKVFNENPPQPALEAAKAADGHCLPLYQRLTQKTQKLAQETLTVKFSWRVRVGGMRGFRELLLPVLHPVYGVPYIPSSSLKGVARAWAEKQHDIVSSEVNRLFGTLDTGIGCVQILDAFPTKPCLSVDMANPQWHWDKSRVEYKPEPHALLSMEQPEFVIGLALTSRGKSTDDVCKVKEWLKQALAQGIGSRVSAGYGRTTLTASLPHSSLYKFNLWTQGMYGASTRIPEFRPTAVRGMLRYWFRAIALGVYPPSQCEELEKTLFGTINPKSKEGSLRIGVEWQEEAGDYNRPWKYTGTILLEAKHKNHLTLIEQVLKLSSHLAGVGRGSRRPLHWNSNRLRGCHWELADMQMACDAGTWQQFLQNVKEAFLAVETPKGSPSSSSSKHSRKRYQDVLNGHARIYLVPSLKQKYSKDVKDWRSEGDKPLVRGKALELLYSSTNYKGVNQDGLGNQEVGGKLGIPSFVLIKSNFPSSEQPYQTVTIFGVDNEHRAAFEGALPTDAVKVWPFDGK